MHSHNVVKSPETTFSLAASPTVSVLVLCGDAKTACSSRKWFKYVHSRRSLWPFVYLVAPSNHTLPSLMRIDTDVGPVTAEMVSFPDSVSGFDEPSNLCWLSLSQSFSLAGVSCPWEFIDTLTSTKSRVVFQGTLNTNIVHASGSRRIQIPDVELDIIWFLRDMNEGSECPKEIRSWVFHYRFPCT